ncbi:helix-turn-helix domain-containing protein [Hydrogenophaga bisanensis]
MSIKVMNLVWDHYPAGGSELLALLALADWSNDTGVCFPSMAAIATKTRLSRSQAQRVVHGLINDGFVSVLENSMGGAPGMTRRYRLNIEKLTGSAGATGRMDATPTGRTDATGSAGATGRMDATPTGRTDATGSAGATGRMDAADGSHGCGETGRMGATQTVIEPSVTTKESGKPAAAGIADPCPHLQIIDAYHRLLPMGRQVREWTPARASVLRSRWREKQARQSLAWWERFFSYVARSAFLTGQASTPGRRPFELSLDWLVKSENMAKVIEGAYHDAEDVAQEETTHA